MLTASLENSMASLGGFCCGKKFIIDHQVVYPIKKKQVTAGEVDKLGKELGNCTHQWMTKDDTNTQALSTLSFLQVKEER